LRAAGDPAARGRTAQRLTPPRRSAPRPPPCPDGQGGTIAPTGQAFALDMVTVGIWNRQGAMDEEFFLWDNQVFYTKMSLG